MNHKHFTLSLTKVPTLYARYSLPHLKIKELTLSHLGKVLISQENVMKVHKDSWCCVRSSQNLGTSISNIRTYWKRLKPNGSLLDHWVQKVIQQHLKDILNPGHIIFLHMSVPFTNCRSSVKSWLTSNHILGLLEKWIRWMQYTDWSG